MLGIMLQKMWHKKWMNFSLLLGCILLVGTVVSFPLYQKAAYDRMLQDEFRNYIATEGVYPAVHYFKTVSNKDKGGKTIEKIEDFSEQINEELGVTPKENILFYHFTQLFVDSDLQREDAVDMHLLLGGMSDLQNNVKMLNGEMFSESGRDENGLIEVIISQNCLIEKGLLVGETLTFGGLKDSEGNPIRIVVKGVFSPESDDPYYWQVRSNEISGMAMMNMDLFRELFTGENAGNYLVTCNFYSLFDYEDIVSEQVDDLYDSIKYITEKGKYRSVIKAPVYMSLLEEYKYKINRISATLLILQIPVLVMLAAFLFMISGQMYEMEKNEISVIKSRGSSRNQIFRLYLYQGIVLTLAGGAIGIPLGALFSRILGSVRNFLDFDTSRPLNVVYTKTVFYYAAVAMAVTLLSITLPAIKHSKVSIVNLKQSKALKKKSWWQLFYLDIVLIGVSLYGYYSFNRNMKDVSGSVLTGKSLDPLLYISSSLLIIGLGLFFLRIQPYLVKFIYFIGKKFYGPASYISFMECIKSGQKKQLIMLFLIMTVSLGMYHSTVARTILDNAIDNTEYLDGADVILKEWWISQVDENGLPTGEYVEPDFSKYGSLKAAQSYTKVLRDDAAYISNGANSRTTISVMGIHTKEFGEMTYVSDDVLEKPYYEYLNELAEDKDGVLLSRNFQSKLGYEVGDTIYYNNFAKKSASGKILDFVDYWPGYTPTGTVINNDGTSETADNFLLITHFELTKNKFGTVPYEIWVHLKDDVDDTEVIKWLDDNEISLRKYVNKNDDLTYTMEDPLLQGTNGVLTMGFIVTLILCAVGYLIYWVMSIKERELIFGVLRACGFHKSELIKMLLNEQLFSGVFAVAAGIGIGELSSRMFVPIIQLAYASSTQVLPLRLIKSTEDMIRLYGVIFGVMLICLVVLIALLFHMNVTKALKLGEE